MKITVSAHEHIENLSVAPAYARVYYSTDFTNDDGQSIGGGALDSTNYAKQVAVTYAAGITSIPSFTGANELDSTVYGVSGGNYATAILALYSAKGKRLSIVYSGLRIPQNPTTTTWADLDAYSTARVEPYRFAYYNTAQIDAKLALLELAPLASDVIDGRMRLNVAPASLLDPVAVGPNDPLVSKYNLTNQITIAGTFSAAIDAVAAVAGTNTLEISRDVTATTKTIPADVPLVFTDGAKITIPNGVTLTINSEIQAGITPIFTFVGTGSVDLTGSKNLTIYPEWFGAVGDFVAPAGAGTDDRPAIVAAITAAPKGSTIRFSKKNYKVSGGSLTITKQVFLQGAGKGFLGSGDLANLVENGTGLYFDTNQHGIILYTTDGSWPEVRGMTITVRSADWVAAATFHGIWMKCAATVEDVLVARFAGNGVHIGSFLTYTNFWALNNVTCVRNHGYGVLVPLNPGDGGGTNNNNAGIGTKIDCRDNGQSGIRDESQHGNTFIHPHCSYNVGYGIETLSNGTQTTSFINGYGENNVKGSYYFGGTAAGTMLLGGTWGVGGTFPDGPSNGVIFTKDVATGRFNFFIQDGSPNFYANLTSTGLSTVDGTGSGLTLGSQTVSGVASLQEGITGAGLWQLKDGSNNVFSQVDIRGVGDKIMTFPYGVKSTSGGIGYAVGAGGTVTQNVSKATGVTLSKPSGKITMNNASLAAGAIVSFVLTNTNIEATDVLILNHLSGGTVGAYTLNAQCGTGSATINVRNNTAGALGEALVIQCVLIKGAIT